MATIRKSSARRTTKPLAEGKLEKAWSASPVSLSEQDKWKQSFSLHFKSEDGVYADPKVHMSATEAYELACYIARQLTKETYANSYKRDNRTDAECLQALAENAKQGVTYI